MRIGETAMIIDSPPFHDFFRIGLPRQHWGCTCNTEHDPFIHPRKREPPRTVTTQRRQGELPRAVATQSRSKARIIPIQIEGSSQKREPSRVEPYDCQAAPRNRNNSGTRKWSREQRAYVIEHELKRPVPSKDDDENRSRKSAIEHELDRTRPASSTDDEKTRRRYIIEHELEKTRPADNGKRSRRHNELESTNPLFPIIIDEEEDSVSTVPTLQTSDEDERREHEELPRTSDIYKRDSTGIIYRINNHSPPTSKHHAIINQSSTGSLSKTRQSSVSSGVAGSSSLPIPDHRGTTFAITATPSYSVYGHLKTRLEKDGRQIDYIRGDGNCFFRALSKDIYGSEEFHDDIRQAVVDLLERYASDFSQFLDSNVDINDHITSMRKTSTWASTMEIYAAATLLQRDIYVLSPDHTGHLYNWLLFSPRFTYNQEMMYHPCHITLCHTHGNHYDRITQLSGQCNCDAETPVLAGVKDYVDLTKD